MSACQAEIPIIDISLANSKAPQELLSAASRHGFVYIENNAEAGISPQAIDEMFELSKRFFAAPIEEKETVSIASNKAGKNHGWLSRGVEKLDPATQKRPDVKEAFNLGLPQPKSDTYEQPLPSSLQAHKQTLVNFQASCHALCQKIFAHLATALSIPQDWFTSRHDFSKGPSGTVFRLLYYPQVESQEEGVDIRAGAHSDYGSVTLLFQLLGQPGLEIKTPSGEWAAVAVDPSESQQVAMKSSARALPILVNIGDLLEDWTGGLLKSTVHRVIFPKDSHGDRYSIAYFCHPLDDALLEPVPSEVVQENATKHGGKKPGANGKVITARDHLMERLAATYKVG